MKILFASSEVTPYSKTGGLGDVSSSLPKALAQMGHDVLVVTPLYGCVERAKLKRLGRYHDGALWEGNGDVRLLFLENETYFGRTGVYGYAGEDYRDNAERFAFFSNQLLPAAREAGFVPDVLHLNDWQTGPAALAALSERETSTSAPRVVFTIHNLGYQGLFPMEAAVNLLGKDRITEAGWTHHGQVAYLKTGIVAADLVTTVSPTYAEEIRGPELGFGLDESLRAKGDRLVGILNGIDTDIWDPATDPHISSRFSRGDLHGKAACRARLCEELGLDPGAGMLITVVSRIAGQKGFDLILDAIPNLVEEGASLAILASGDPEMEKRLLNLERRHPGRIGVRLDFDESASHRFYAGGDAFLMPSRYEPCGLSQMYALRYGTLPIVREVGGLKDTVVEGETGFLFGAPSVSALLEAAARARRAFEDRRGWEAMMVRGMGADFSWGASASAYVEAYRLAGA